MRTFPQVLLFGPGKGKIIFSLLRANLTKTPSGIPPVAILIHSRGYICPWPSWTCSSWKMPAVVAFTSEARALLSSLLLLMLCELQPAQKVVMHIFTNNSPAPLCLCHAWLLYKIYLKIHQKKKERVNRYGGNRLVLGGSSLSLHIAMLDIHYRLNAALNLDLNSNQGKI